jgi:imidazolonepropionase-like amidohydrolase
MRWLLGLVGGVGVFAAGLAFVLLPPHQDVPPRGNLIISGVTIFNPGRERIADQTIVIEGSRIAAVRPRQEGDPASLCEGCIAMPGLIDAHVHTPPRTIVGNQELFSLLYLAYGVTSVRDVGEADSSVASLARDLNAARIVGPRMFRCGPVIESEPSSWPAALVVETAEDATAAVDRLADEGVDCIKVYNELNADAYRAIAIATARHGLRLIGHVPHSVGLRGVHDFESQHMTGFPYIAHARPPLNSDIRDVDVLTMTPEDVNVALETAAENRVTFTPTLANLSLRLSASDPVQFPPPQGGSNLPAFWSTVWQNLVGHPTGEADISARLESQTRYHAMVAAARARGIDVLAGTDTLMPWVTPGESLHLEIEQLAAAFGDNEAALAAATTVNATHIAPGEIGGIEPGARADILLLTSDPVLDVSSLRRWSYVIADGRLYARGDIDAAVERYREHFRGPLYSAIMGTLVQVMLGDSGHANAH